jgi:hypothetical protein
MGRRRHEKSAQPRGEIHRGGGPTDADRMTCLVLQKNKVNLDCRITVCPGRHTVPKLTYGKVATIVSVTVSPRRGPQRPLPFVVVIDPPYPYPFLPGRKPHGPVRSCNVLKR